MTQEYIKQIALDTIMEQQAETKVNADRDNLLYLMGFNDGVIELALNLREKTQAESEDAVSRDHDPCETCGYAEGSPFCLQYCPYDAERKKEQEPCDDAISRILARMWNCRGKHTTSIDKVKMEQIIHEELPSVTQKSGHCKECKYFEYDSVAKVDGIPLIVAHEICNKWGDGCKTSEDGYCYLFEPQESEGKE